MKIELENRIIDDDGKKTVIYQKKWKIFGLKVFHKIFKSNCLIDIKEAEGEEKQRKIGY